MGEDTVGVKLIPEMLGKYFADSTIRETVTLTPPLNSFAASSRKGAILHADGARCHHELNVCHPL